MKIRTLKLPPELDRRLDRYAAELGRSRSFVAREALSSYLDERQPARQSVSALVADLAGCLDGPGDLSTNPKYMEGFGESRASEPPALRRVASKRGRRKR